MQCWKRCQRGSEVSCRPSATSPDWQKPSCALFSMTRFGNAHMCREGDTSRSISISRGRRASSKKNTMSACLNQDRHSPEEALSLAGLFPESRSQSKLNQRFLLHLMGLGRSSGGTGGGGALDAQHLTVARQT